MKRARTEFPALADMTGFALIVMEYWSDGVLE
jgi:hypothetical protein